MKRATNRRPKGPGPQPAGKRGRRVLVHLVTEQRRPLFVIEENGDYFCVDDPKFPKDSEEWLAEKKRRFAIDRLLTPGERKFYELYCRLRDD